MKFKVIDRNSFFPDVALDSVYLKFDNWNDFSFVTSFEVVLYDERGLKIDLGSVKIGFKGQSESDRTYSKIPKSFDELPDEFFSLGQDVTYYQKLSDSLSQGYLDEFTVALRDVVAHDAILAMAESEGVFHTSLLRYVSRTAIEGQFRRVLRGEAPLSDFDFYFTTVPSEKIAGVDLRFSVDAGSVPSTNIHAIIGRNGTGKTTLLNKMVLSLIGSEKSGSYFSTESIFEREAISDNYFSSLISVAFSAFDPFLPPAENADPEKGIRYTYIGLKDPADKTGARLKSMDVLREEALESLGECFADKRRKERWLKAIRTLETDQNFAWMELPNLSGLDGWKSEAAVKINNMSSGHAIVLLTLSRLVARVEEKTLVLLDEPESHLHPQLLSAFTRALSELLHDRNGVAIVATHSPVVLQEIPRSCVYVIERSRLSMTASRPRSETFGENVGTLTREVFGLEVVRSGFHSVLAKSVASGAGYEEIMEIYRGQLGQEARGILMAIIAERRSREDHL